MSEPYDGHTFRSTVGNPKVTRIPTHAEVLAAIDKAAHPGWQRREHCDDLRATAERHAPVFIVNVDPPVPECRHDWARGTDRFQWPCEDYQQVVDRLTAWGVL